MNEVVKSSSNEIEQKENQSINPVSLIQLAIEKNMDIAAMKELFEMQQRWEKSESIKSFNVSFSKFQSECPTINKSVHVQFKTKTGKTDYWHASRDDIEKGTKEILYKNGISYSFEQRFEGGQVTVTCFLNHVKGHQKTSTLSAPPDLSGGKNQIQGIGSTSAYLERYTLASVLAISQAKIDNDCHAYGESIEDQNKLKPCPEHTFENNFEKLWAPKIRSGEKTAQYYFDFIQTKGLYFTDEQIQKITNVKKESKNGN